MSERIVDTTHGPRESVLSVATRKVEQEPCRCVRCGDCHGQGNYRMDIGGFDDLETCDTCGGSGITETCDRCQLLTDMDYDRL